MAPRVLIADKLSPAAVDIFKQRGLDFDIKVGLTKDELIAHAHVHLAPFKVPKRVFFCAAIPRNTAGKVLKRVLREDYATRMETEGT